MKVAALPVFFGWHQSVEVLLVLDVFVRGWQEVEPGLFSRIQ
jgi:hypothetical protein